MKQTASISRVAAGVIHMLGTYSSRLAFSVMTALVQKACVRVSATYTGAHIMKGR